MRKFPCSSLVSADLHSIKVRLVRLNKNQLWLSDTLGVTHSTMSNWLSGTTNIPFVVRVCIEDILSSAELDIFGSSFPSLVSLAGSAGTQQG